MTQTKIFKINDLVDLRLIDRKTYIYVNNKQFFICKRLLLNIPIKRIHEADEINSIDDAVKIFKSPPDSGCFIHPDQEFEAHCSNIQAFFENGLNINILHSNIAFPLLKKLVDYGYNPAIRILKEEIAKRFNEGNENSRLFLHVGDYFKYLNEEEKQALEGFYTQTISHQRKVIYTI